MKRVMLFLLVSVLLASNIWAQASNDVGATVQNGPSLPPGSPDIYGVVPCPPQGTVQTGFTGANLQSGRIFRDAIPSICPSKVYPGIFNVGTNYNYETFTYRNTSNAAACVTINFDPNLGATPCGTNAHASAYLTSYNPASQSTNYVGDVGASITDDFSFTVPAATDMVLVITNTASQATCDFAFEVVSLPCAQPASVEVPTLGGMGLVALVSLLALAGVGFLLFRRRHA